MSEESIANLFMDSIPEEEDAQETEAVVAEESKEAAAEDAPAEDESPVSEETEEDDDEEDEAQKEKSQFEKRFKDTQADNTRLRMAMASIQKKVAAGETLTEEDLTTLSKASVDELSGDSNPFTEIEERLAGQLESSKALIAKSYPDYVERVEGFKLLFQSDPNVGAELQSLPADEQLIYLLDKGGEASQLVAQISEHGSMGEALKAMSSRVQELEGKLAKAKEKSKTSTAKRPNVSGSSTPKAEGDKIKDSNPFDSMFA